MRHILILPLTVAAIVLAACATSPAPADTGPAPELVIAEALADENPYSAEEILTALLARTSLKADQRAAALYQRGSLRRQAADDRRGAVEDFEAMLALAPTHPLASRAQTELDFARSDVDQVEASMNRFLTLSQWFDGTWVLGDHDLAAERYKASGLAPTPEQVVKLKAAGYVCASDAEDRRLHLYGDDRDDLAGLEWCTAEAVS